MATVSNRGGKPPAETPVQSDMKSPAEASPEAQAAPGADSPHEPRLTVPRAPATLNDSDATAVERIRAVLTEAVYSKHAEAPQYGRDQLLAQSMLNLSPAVAQYRAEAVDYLAGKIPK